MTGLMRKTLLVAAFIAFGYGWYWDDSNLVNQSNVVTYPSPKIIRVDTGRKEFDWGIVCHGIVTVSRDRDNYSVSFTRADGSHQQFSGVGAKSIFVGDGEPGTHYTAKKFCDMGQE